MRGGPLTPRPNPRRRLVGVDLARALAFGGMLLAHYAASSQPHDPRWLRILDQTADGRAAPLFCMVLGVGAGLLAAQGAPNRVFVRRGITLFALGLAIWPFVDRVYLILPQYGVLLALFPLLRRLPTRCLLPAAAVAFLVPSLIAAVIDGHGLRSAAEPSSYGELLDLGHLVRYLAWTGGYPVVGWLGFVLVGMWLARQPLEDRVIQWRLLAGAGAVALTQPLAAVASRSLGGRPHRNDAGGIAALFDSSAHSNQTAWYVLASATAVAVVAACLLVTRRSSTGVDPLVHLGQLALTAYLAHILLGELVVWEWLDRARPPLVIQVAVVAVVFVGFTALSTLWRARYQRGPVETLVRTVSR